MMISESIHAWVADQAGGVPEPEESTPPVEAEPASEATEEPSIEPKGQVTEPVAPPASKGAEEDPIADDDPEGLESVDIDEEFPKELPPEKIAFPDGGKK